MVSDAEGSEGKVLKMDGPLGAAPRPGFIGFRRFKGFKGWWWRLRRKFYKKKDAADAAGCVEGLCRERLTAFQAEGCGLPFGQCL